MPILKSVKQAVLCALIVCPVFLISYNESTEADSGTTESDTTVADILDKLAGNSNPFAFGESADFNLWICGNLFTYRFVFAGLDI